MPYPTRSLRRLGVDTPTAIGILALYCENSQSTVLLWHRPPVELRRGKPLHSTRITVLDRRSLLLHVFQSGRTSARAANRALNPTQRPREAWWLESTEVCS
jgi:hypothetical protein